MKTGILGPIQISATIHVAVRNDDGDEQLERVALAAAASCCVPETQAVH